MNPLKPARRLAGKMIRAVPWLRRQWYVSTDYRLSSEAEIRAAAPKGWWSPLAARRQERAYLGLLAEMRAGRPREDLSIAAQAVDALGRSEVSLLEVGCGSGYYKEIFEQLSRTRLAYTGIDYSPAMVARARARYPDADFRQMDATALEFSYGAFDVTFNGVSLMHILDWRKAVAESRRVARLACIFHSVPVFPARATAYIQKYAYGAPVEEIVFNRGELLACFASNGLKVAQSWTGLPYDVHAVAGEHSFAETFLCIPEGQV
jgi:ubiquinone/menaquinone biosynthesis C-methylase UbiE